MCVCELVLNEVDTLKRQLSNQNKDQPFTILILWVESKLPMVLMFSQGGRLLVWYGRAVPAVELCQIGQPTDATQADTAKLGQRGKELCCVLTQSKTLSLWLS